MLKWNIAGGALGLALTACATPYSDRDLRTEWTIDRYQDVMVSNSPTFNSESTRENGHFKLAYTFLAENLSPTSTYQFALSKALIGLNKQTVPLTCKTTYAKEGDLALAPEKRALIECSASLAASVENDLSSKDTAAQIKIPFTGPQGESWIVFAYTLRTKDFK
jgi:hypothetical protein